MRKIKNILVLLILCVIVLGFASCKIKSPTISGNTNIDDDVIYSKQVGATLVLGEGVSESDVSKIRTAYREATGKEITIKSDDKTYGDHQIIIGKTENDLSTLAYRMVSRFDDEDGYYIYSDGKSVAIAFDEAFYGVNVCFNEAIERFVSDYMQTDKLVLKKGRVCKDSFDPIEKQREREEKYLNKLWEIKFNQISDKLYNEDKAAAPLVVSELQKLEGIFLSEQIVSWLANLYDPESGGFYYSNSARDNIGYGTDLESTALALGLAESVIAQYDGTVYEYFGEEISSRFISFAKNMQSAENGYFYHPQWSADLVNKNSERRDRDVLAALYILNTFGASPTYDTPNGVKGDGVTVPVSMLVTPLRANSVSAVSKVVSIAESDEFYIPAHLKSKAAFETYLSSLDIRTNTAVVCETLYADIPVYLHIDRILEQNGEYYRLTDLLTDYIERNQNSASAIWDKSNDITCEQIGEIQGIVKIYNALGRTFPRYDALFETAKRVLNSGEELENINNISTVWMSLAAVVDNLNTYTHEFHKEQLFWSLSSFYSTLASSVNNTSKQLSRFLNTTDGSFSTTPDGSTSDYLGVPVAIPMSEEGDVNGTLQAVKNTWLAIFGVLDIGYVPVFNSSDMMLFEKTLLEMGVVIKHEIKNGEPLNFEEYEIGEIPTDVYHGYKTEGSDSRLEIVEDAEEYGNVLRLVSAPEASDQYTFPLGAKLTGATCLAFEFDMRVLPETSTGTFATVYLHPDTYSIALDRQGNEIRFLERSTRSESSSYITDLGIRADVGEWFSLRVEYYPGDHDTVRIKVFFNENCIAVTDNYFESPPIKFNGVGNPNSEYTALGVFGAGNKNMDLLMDNVVAEATFKTYSAETEESAPFLNMNVDSPDKPKTSYDFESSSDGDLPEGFIPGPEGIAVKSDTDGNKVLSLSENAGELILPLDQRGSKINSALIEFDITVDPSSEAGAAYRINFDEYLYRERSFAAVQIIVVEENGSKYFTFANVTSDQAGTNYKDVKLSLGIKYRLQFHLFFEECALVVSVEEESVKETVGINSNVLDQCKRFYMGKTSIEAATPNIPSEIFIDNLVCERINGSFAEATKPQEDRVVHEFNDTADLEISGIQAQDGVLSFESVGNKEAYVKIPVNSRVNAANMALVGLDISGTERISGSIIISFTDKQNNFIAAFELVRAESGVQIYEHTANGRYKAPIHTVNKPSFNICFEYSREKESFNILVDGKYVAASSLIYTRGSKDNEFEFLRIGAKSAAGLTVDNVYAEEIVAIFKAHEVTMVNTDGTDKVITYETSSFASMPDKLSFSLGMPTSFYRIKEEVINNQVSKALEFYVGRGSAGSSLSINRTQESAGSNAAFFETDIMLMHTGTRVTDIEIQVRSNVGDTLAYRFVLQMGHPDKVLKAIGGDGGDYTVDLNAEEGEWFKLRLEYADTPYDYTYDGKTDPMIRAYINGELIGVGHTARYPDSIQPASSIHQVRFYIASGREGLIYLDNTALGQCNMSYEKPVDADTHTVTYEPGIITDKTKPALGTGSTAKITEMTVEGQVTKVLSIYTANTNKDKLTVVPTVTLEGANGIIFETDIMIAPSSENGVFYLEPTNKSGKQPFRLTIRAAKDGALTLSSYNSEGRPDANIPEGTVIGNSGEWIHLKVEYMYPRADYNGDRVFDILYKVYAEDQLVATGYQPYKPNAYFAPIDMTGFVFTAESETEADIYFDNTRFWQMQLTPDEAPEYEYPEDAPLGGGDYKPYPEGWTQLPSDSVIVPTPDTDPDPDPDPDDGHLGGSGNTIVGGGWTKPE